MLNVGYGFQSIKYNSAVWIFIIDGIAIQRALKMAPFFKKIIILFIYLFLTAITWEVVGVILGNCDIAVYSKYVFDLAPISGTEFLKPLEFPEC